MPASVSWTTKENQLLSFMTASRTNQGTSPFAMLGAVCIGKLVKFFELQNGENHLSPFQGQIKPLNMAADALIIHEKILAIKNIIGNAFPSQST